MLTFSGLTRALFHIDYVVLEMAWVRVATGYDANQVLVSAFVFPISIRASFIAICGYAIAVGLVGGREYII